MALFDGLLGGGSADPYDLYGDTLTAKQREALRARSSDQTWANAANFLAKAAMPTNKKIPLGGLLAGLAGAMGGSNQDEAALTALKGGEITAKIAKLRREQRLLDELDPVQKEFLRRRMAQYGYGGVSPPAGAPAVPSATPTATPGGGFPPPATGAPTAPPTGPEDDTLTAPWSLTVPPRPYSMGAWSGSVPPRIPYRGVGAAGVPPVGAGDGDGGSYGGGGPGPAAGLLGGPTEGIAALGGGNDLLSVIAALSQGGGGGSPAPFDLASLGQGQGLPDVGPVRVEALSGKAAPAGGVEMPFPTLQNPNKPRDAWAQGVTYDQPKVPFGQDPGDRVRPEGGYGSSRADTVAYWRSRGMPEHVAEGIADRVGVESSYRSDAMGDRGTSGGLYQHHADRLARLKSFAASEGKPWTDPDVQHRFAGSETQGGDPQATRAMSAIANAPDRQTAAKLWDRHFERSAAGPGSRLPDAGRVRIEPLGGEAARAGGSGLIPGLGVAPEELAILNSMYEAAGVDAPFKSLLDTYYKSPGYLEEKTRVETQARKDIEAKEDPLIEAQKTRQRLLVEEEIKPRLEAAIEKAKSPVLEEREKALAEIARETKRLEIAGQAAVSIQDIDIIGDDGKTSSTKLPALEIARRNANAAERRARGDLTPRAGDIATRPVLSPEETARQTQRGRTQEETREVDVWTPAGPVKQTMSNQEIAAREKLAASRGPGGAPQIGDIINKPALTPADQKIADSLGEEFIATRRQALAADKTIRDTHNLRSKLDSGMFTGLDANFNLFMARLGDTLGWKNLSDSEKVKNTETYIAGLGSEVLAMVKDLRPASNIDLQFAERMVGGQNLSAASIRQLLDMREEYARLAIQRHNEEAAGRNPAIFQGARRELPMPPAYQPKELTSPGGNKVIINR